MRVYSGMVNPDGYLSAPEGGILKSLCSMTSSLSWACSSNLKGYTLMKDQGIQEYIPRENVLHM